MKALVTKKVKVVRNPLNHCNESIEFIGMNKVIIIYYLLFIPIYRKEGIFTD